MKKMPSPQKVRLAIFDIDGTVFRSSLVIEVFNALVARGVFPKSASHRVERNYVRWLDRKGHYNDYLMTLVIEFYKNLKGKRTAAVEPVIASVVRLQKDRVYRFTRDLIKALKKQGYFPIAISNSPDAMTVPFALSAGFKACIGRTYEVLNGRYTGAIRVDGAPFAVDAWIDKVALLKKYFQRRGMVPDFSNSFAVGDSEGDVPLLAAVGHPIAFNPSATLVEVARRRKWNIIVERKDVMYFIKDASIITANERQRVKVHLHKDGARRKR